MSVVADQGWQLGPLTLRSRLIVGTGKYRDVAQTAAAVEASGADMITVAIRRVDFSDPQHLFKTITPDRYRILPNTAGCYSADEAIRTARLAREALDTTLVKLEVIGDPKTLFPDVVETIKAAAILVKEGFHVLPYSTDDLIAAKKLLDVGCLAVMPLAAPIGSGLGIRNPHNLMIMREEISAPLIVDAGVGAPSHAARAMELGFDGVLMNSGIAAAGDPVAMARAMRLAVEAGRLGFLARPMAPQKYANASSPTAGLIE